MTQYIGHLSGFHIRTAADPQGYRLAIGQLSTLFGICTGNPACLDGIAGFRPYQNLQPQILVIQEVFRLCFIQVHQVFHGLHHRLRAAADRNIDFGTHHHFLTFKHRKLIHDHAAFILIAVGSVLQHDLEIRQILHIFVILTQQVGQGHIIRLAAKATVEHGHQENHNGDHRYHRASYDSNGGNIAAVLLRLWLATALGFVTRSAGRLFPTSRSRTGVPAACYSFCSSFWRQRLFLHLRHRRQHPQFRTAYHIIVKQHRRVLPELFHVSQHLGSRVIPLIGLQGHILHNDLFQTTGNIGIHRRRQLGTTVDMLNGNGHRGFAIIRRPPRHHFIHNHAQGVQIGPIIDPAALSLLGRDVMNGAQGFLGQRIALGHEPGNAKVCHLHGAILQHHNIMGLNVPVNDAATMGMFQCLADLNAEMKGLFPVQHTFFLHVLLQGNSLDQFHHNIVCDF